MPLLDPLLKEILICPHCRSKDLREDEPAERLRCEACGLAYPLRAEDGFPVMLIDEADKPAGFVLRDSAPDDDTSHGDTPQTAAATDGGKN